MPPPNPPKPGPDPQVELAKRLNKLAEEARKGKDGFTDLFTQVREVFREFSTFGAAITAVSRELTGDLILNFRKVAESLAAGGRLSVPATSPTTVNVAGGSALVEAAKALTDAAKTFKQPAPVVPPPDPPKPPAPPGATYGFADGKGDGSTYGFADEATGSRRRGREGIYGPGGIVPTGGQTPPRANPVAGAAPVAPPPPKENPFEMLGAGLRAFKSEAGGLWGAMRAGATSVGAAALQASHAATRAATAPFQVMQSAISALQIHVASFVQKASPLALIQFQRAVDDLTAVIGRALLPVIEAATRAIRGVANAIFGLSPVGQKAVAVLASATVGIAVFTAAVVALETVATGGLAPAIGGVVAAMGGMSIVFGEGGGFVKTLADTVGGALEMLGGVLQSLAASFAPVLAVIGELAKAAVTNFAYIGGVIASFAPVVADLGKVFLDLTQAAAPFTQMLLLGFGEGLKFTAAALKAVMPFFTGLSGVLAETGKALQPVLEELTLLGTDTLASLAAPLRDLTAAFGEVLTETLRAGLPVITAAAKAFRDMVLTLREVVATVMALFGLELQKTELGLPEAGRKDSTGAAVRGASFGDSANVLREAMKNAFMSGTAAQQRPEVKTAAAVTEMAAGVKELKQQIETIAGYVEDIPTNLVATIVNAWDQIKGSLPKMPELPKVPDLPRPPTPGDVGRFFLSPAAPIIDRAVDKLRGLF